MVKSSSYDCHINTFEAEAADSKMTEVDIDRKLKNKDLAFGGNISL